ncbi:helix-turn-helix domain-containing protein [Chitinophaga costaii]|uniref:helix-turn-helix domain-containing protein n=1 Tax=Chitinophaga costaii TaxID=1335309 RepID=UPI0013FD8F4A|nr:helix-turn-helix domain-containing protein [Chitinophaga costaii]
MGFAFLLKKFQSLVAAHYTTLQNVAAYAYMRHISARHLGAVEKQQSGKNAIEHIHALNMQEAKRQLFHTTDSSKEVTYHLGYDEASYFKRLLNGINSKHRSPTRTPPGKCTSETFVSTISLNIPTLLLR